MKKFSFLSILTVTLFSVGGCTDDGEVKPGTDIECSAEAPCSGGKICINGKCAEQIIARECDDAHPCSGNRVCVLNKCIFPVTPPECSDSAPCLNGKICDAGKCVDPQCTDAIPCLNGKICDAGKCVDPQCTDAIHCLGGKICDAGKCIDPECSDAKPCADEKICVQNKCVIPECSASRPCADGKICENNKCIEPECSDTKPCSGKKICENGKCVRPAAECDESNPCPADKFCHNAKCVDKVPCVSDSQCGSGMFCDNYNCVPNNSCSETRTCPDEKICRDGVCLDEKPKTACDKQHACTGTGETCVAGKCVKCSCQNGETCTDDGKCIKTNVSELKNIKVGDPCTWSKDFSFCDGNRLFSCSQSAGEPGATVKVVDCGGNICATSPTDGLNCYEPCPEEGDLYGECLNDYNSMDGYSTGISFKTHCTPSVEGPLIWTFTVGYDVCSAGCFNGSCLIKPKEFGQACTQTSFKDACIGDWSTWCSADDNTTGVVIGENCAEGFIKDKDKFTCTFSEKGYTDCVTACTEENAEKRFCHQTLSGDITSDTRICRKDINGKLGYFLKDREKCTGGCNPKTGRCQ